MTTARGYFWCWVLTSQRPEEVSVRCICTDSEQQALCELELLTWAVASAKS